MESGGHHFVIQGFFKCDYKYTFADVLMTASPNKTQNKHALTLEQCAILQNL